MHVAVCVGRIPMVPEVVSACGYKVEDTDHPRRIYRGGEAVRVVAVSQGYGSYETGNCSMVISGYMQQWWTFR